MLKYTAILVPEEDGGYSVEVPALPGCYTQSETREEALAMAREAVELYLESCKVHNESVPEEARIESLVIEVKETAAPL